MSEKGGGREERGPRSRIWNMNIMMDWRYQGMYAVVVAYIIFSKVLAGVRTVSRGVRKDKWGCLWNIFNL